MLRKAGALSTGLPLAPLKAPSLSLFKKHPLKSNSVMQVIQRGKVKKKDDYCRNSNLAQKSDEVSERHRDPTPAKASSIAGPWEQDA